jgi:MFS family permease
MLPVAIAVMVASSPGQTFCVTYFNDPIATALGLSQTSLSTIYMVSTLLAAATLPFVGAAADRIGLRWATVLVAAAFGMACAGMALAGGIVSLAFAFFALRALGPGALVLLSNNMLAAWFHRRLGAVTGANSFFMSIAMGGVPWVALALIGGYGWRWAYVMLGASVWMLVLPLVVIFFRNRPEEVGQSIDGDVREPGREAPDRSAAGAFAIAQAEASVATPDLSLPMDELPTAASLSDDGLSFAEARRERSFWILLLGMAAWTMVGTGMIFAIVPLFKSRGLTEVHAATAYTLQTLAQAMMQLSGGLLSRFATARRLLAVALGGIATSAAVLATGWLWATTPAYVIYGAGQGLMTIVAGTSWAHYFGRKHLGKIRGASMMAAIGGSSIGPVVLGVSLDYLGGFAPGLWLLAASAAVIALAAPLATPPRGRNAI